MPNHIRWGVVATVKAPLLTIADWAAYHLDLGAHRVIVYLDAPDDAAFDALNAHPKLRVVKADAANWRSSKRPDRHQPRQSANLRHAYRRKARDLDWLAHIDVDEFLWPLNPLEDQLAALSIDCLCARIRPIEALSGEGQNLPDGQIPFKAMTNDRAQRQRETQDIYPTFGAHLNGGFLSHVAGKLFIRTGQDGLEMKIHNIWQDGVQNPGQVELTGTELCHLHAKSFGDWQASFRYRHEQGAYRAELAPNRARESGGMTMHELFAAILEDAGDAGLRAFYDEVCLATPDLRARLDAHGLLRLYDLDLAEKRRKQFPDLA
ncbi:glycosyltransferase family 2 protein [Rhodobacteraceae bacterium 10Alg 79]|uniref:Glycosyltransferase family 2 protein n=2 Tax=Rhodalgimonas zhirmunskyi TaxID=2964767 RepID=A0AAJ1U8M4_9RHOB|nr:glycosyltransferase family 2 protein [Rhodoalgimonas zhirmunskyi]